MKDWIVYGAISYGYSSLFCYYCSFFTAKSVAGVALSGPKLETAVVTLIDGTQFGISGKNYFHFVHHYIFEPFLFIYWNTS